MLSILSDTEKAVVETITKGLLPEPALEYLRNVGFKMSRATYFRHKKKIEETKQERMQFIAQHFQELHLEKIDRLELIDKLMWEQFEKEQQPYRKVKILEAIANAQSTISSYYESSTIAIQVSSKFNGNSENEKMIEPMTFDEWAHDNPEPRIDEDSYYSDEENGQYYWRLHKKYNEYVKDWKDRMFGPDQLKSIVKRIPESEAEGWTDKPVPLPKAVLQIPSEINSDSEGVQERKTLEREKDTEESNSNTVDIDILGRDYKPFDVVKWIKCTYPKCNKWLKNKEMLEKHVVKYHK